jgi:hypothetical protein
MLIGGLGWGVGVIASKTVAKGHPKTRKIANFDNIKGNVN